MNWFTRHKKDEIIEQKADPQNAKKKPNAQKEETKSISAFTLIKELVAGDVFLREIVQKQYLLILLFFLLSLIYINNKFLYEGELRDLEKQRKELADLKIRSVTILKNVKHTGRRTMVMQELNEQGSDLEETSEPMIIID